MASPLAARGRGQTYGTLFGLVLGMLIAGLLVPFVFADGIPAASGTSSLGTSDPLGAPGTDPLGQAPTAGPSAGVPTVPGATAGPGAGGPVIAPGTGQPGSAPGSPQQPTGPVAGPGVGNGQGGQGGSARGPLTASDVGVTPTTIKVGLGILDTGGASKFAPGAASASPDDQKAVYNAYIAELNANGGIYGRKVIPSYVTYDPLSADSMRAACVKWTEDEKVFAVMTGGYYGDPVLCLTVQHKTPYIGNIGDPDTEFQQSRGLYFTIAGSADRFLRNMVGELDRRGLLRGKKIGVLDDAGASTAPAVNNGLIPALKKYGYTVTVRQTLSSDTSTAASQIPVAVNQMRNAGVDVVIPGTNVVYISQFAQQANSQGYRPNYYVSDFAGNTTDVATLFYQNSMDANLIGFTSFRFGEFRAGLPEAPNDAQCRQTYEKRSGKKLDRSNAAAYNTTMDVCNYFRMFAAGANKAGTKLTRTGFSQGLQNAGTLPFAYLGGDQTFRPGKYYGGDYLRPIRYAANCTCWTAAESFVKARS